MIEILIKMFSKLVDLYIGLLNYMNITKLSICISEEFIGKVFLIKVFTIYNQFEYNKIVKYEDIYVCHFEVNNGNDNLVFYQVLYLNMKDNILLLKSIKFLLKIKMFNELVMSYTKLLNHLNIRILAISTPQNFRRSQLISSFCFNGRFEHDKIIKDDDRYVCYLTVNDIDYYNIKYDDQSMEDIINEIKELSKKLEIKTSIMHMDIANFLKAFTI